MSRGALTVSAEEIAADGSLPIAVQLHSASTLSIASGGHCASK